MWKPFGLRMIQESAIQGTRRGRGRGGNWAISGAPRWALWIGLSAVLALAGCSKEDSGSKTGPAAKFEVVEEGSGESNAEPLWPMRPGARWDFQKALEGESFESFKAGAVVGITRVTDRFGKPWLLEQVTGSESGADMWARGLGWNQGRMEAYWSMDNEGLVLRAYGTNDPLETPLLMIPATVRHGMKWEVRNGDDLLLSGVITGGEERDTEWGKRRVWKVDVTVAERNPHEGEGTVLTPMGDHLPSHWVQEFVEGRGPIGASMAIVPLEDRTYELPKRVAMQPLPKVPKEYRGSVESFSVTQDAATGHFEPQMGVTVPGVGPTQVSKMTASGTSLASWEYFYGRRICYRTDGNTIEEIDPSVPAANPYLPWDWKECQDAAGVVYDAQGLMATRQPFEVDGTSPEDWFYDFGPGIQIMGLSSIGTFFGNSFYVPGSKGLARYDGTISGGVYMTEIHEPGTRPGWKEAQNPTSAVYEFTLGPWAQQWDVGHMHRAVALAPEKDRKLDILFMGQGVLGHGQLRSGYEPQIENTDDRWTVGDSGLDFHTYDEFVVVTHSDNTREIYQVSEDGLIWRVEMKDGALQRTFLVAVEVPEGHQVVGVVPTAQDELQVWTQEGFTWRGTLGIDFVGWSDIYVDDVFHHAWKVKIPADAVPEPPPISGELFLQASGRDVLVCGPMGNQLPLEGWKLGGQEPTVIDIDHRCLLLMRPLPVYSTQPPPPEEAVLIPQEPTAWIVEGTLPEVGPVTMQFTPVQPRIPHIMRAAGDDTIAAGEEYNDNGGLGEMVRIWGRGKAMHEHRWGPLTNSRCSEFGWQVQLWTDRSMPEYCQPGLLCYGLVRVAPTLEQTRTFLIPLGTLAPLPNEVAAPTLDELPDGCPAVRWGPWFYRIDDDEGPVEVPDPYAEPTPEWARCEEDMFVDHNYTIPDVSRYNCELWDGTTKVVDLPRFQLRNLLELKGDGASYWVTNLHEPYLWRMDHGTWEVRLVKVPHADHFGTMGVQGLDGYCGRDGVCYLILEGAPEEPDGVAPWEIVQIDHEVSGMHPVYLGWAYGAGPGGISGDDELLILGRGNLTWRGFRSMQPDTCDGCSPQELCLSGFCDCEFGQVRPDGYCETDLPTETYTSCKEALANGAAPGQPVRIDGDGPDYPTPEFIALCEGGSDWTQAPLDFQVTSAVAGNGSCALPTSEGVSWNGAFGMLHMSSLAGLHGEFEAVVDFGELLEEQHEGYSHVGTSFLILEDAEQFDAETGRWAKACNYDVPGPVGEEIRMRFHYPGKMEILSTGPTTYLGDWAPGTKMRITREGDGLIRIYGDETLLWTSDRPYKKDVRMVRKDQARVKLLSARWKGNSGAFCIPRCEGRECGSDLCGGTCGDCIENAHCTDDGLCACDAPRFYYDGEPKECLFPTGSEEYPAASCEQAITSKVPWAGEPWIDPDGPGGEAPFHMMECGSYSAVNPNMEPWTFPPTDFLGSVAGMVADSVAGSCSRFDNFAPAFAWPCTMNGAFAILDGQSVPSGLAVAATSRFLKGRFYINGSLYAGSGGQEARLHLDPMDSFDATGAWLGWLPACGTTADLNHRLTLTAATEGIWVQEGMDAPTFLGPSSFGYVAVQRAASGEVEILLSDQTVVYKLKPGTLPDQIRMVGEVQAGEGVRVSISNLRWW